VRYVIYIYMYIYIYNISRLKVNIVNTIIYYWFRSFLHTGVTKGVSNVRILFGKSVCRSVCRSVRPSRTAKEILMKIATEEFYCSLLKH